MEIRITKPAYDLDAALRYKEHRISGAPMSKAEEAYCREEYRKYRGAAHAKYSEETTPETKEKDPAAVPNPEHHH